MTRRRCQPGHDELRANGVPWRSTSPITKPAPTTTAITSDDLEALQERLARLFVANIVHKRKR